MNHPNTSAILAMDSSKTTIEVPQSRKDDTTNAAKQDPALPNLQFVPRKRTNTDHLITPKKPLRQTTMDNDERAPPIVENPAGNVAKAARMTKSLRKSIVGNISDNMADRRASRQQTRLSSGIQQFTGTEGAASGGKELESSVGHTSSKRRALRRSTIATRRSIVHVELTSETGHIESQSTEQGPHDASISVASISTDTTTAGKFLPFFGPENLHVNDTTNERDIKDAPVIDTQIGVAIESQENSSCNSTLVVESKARDIVESTLLELSANCKDGRQHAQAADMQENFVKSTEMTGDQGDDITETQGTSIDLPDLISSSTAGEQFVKLQDRSNADGVVLIVDGGSLTLDVFTTSPSPISSTGALEPGDEVTQTENDIASRATEGVNIHQDVQNTELPQVPDLRNTILNMAYDHDDTDMLRNFLTRVKANKAAKAPPKRKRSLPHSPLRIPLGDLDNNVSPSPQRKENELGTVEPSPSKRRKKTSPLAQSETEPEPRRSGRTRPPVKEPPGVPSFIPVRRLGQDIDNTITLKRNEEKDLAALTRVNTRKNKGNALTALEVLAKKAEEKEDPIMRQRLLKEVFDEKVEKGKKDKEKKGREKKTVKWAEELAQFQTMGKDKLGENEDDKEKEKVVVVQSGEEKKQSAVRVGVRSKTALGKALNGTPMPKRKMRGRV